MKRSLILVLILGAMAIAATCAYRWIQIRKFPIGSGKFRDSSDQRFQVDASNLVYEDFWGRRRECYRFSVFDLRAGGKTIRRIDLTPGAHESVVQLRREARIDWEADSSAVTVGFGSTELKIKLTEP
jgi:hypothetical protein